MNGSTGEVGGRQENESIRNYHKAKRLLMDWLRHEHVLIVRLDCLGTPDYVWDQLFAIVRLMQHNARVTF